MLKQAWLDDGGVVSGLVDYHQTRVLSVDVGVDVDVDLLGHLVFFLFLVGSVIKFRLSAIDD
jgi:hypothetical protein